jgi:hypothetical protein
VLLLQPARGFADALFGKQQHAQQQDDGVQQQILPFSVMMKQLEAAVTQQVLPTEALAANRQAMATLKEFARGLENPSSYPPSAVKVVKFVFR